MSWWMELGPMVEEKVCRRDGFAAAEKIKYPWKLSFTDSLIHPRSECPQTIPASEAHSSTQQMPVNAPLISLI